LSRHGSNRFSGCRWGPGRSRFAAVSQSSTWSPGCSCRSPEVTGSPTKRLLCGNGLPNRMVLDRSAGRLGVDHAGPQVVLELSPVARVIVVAVATALTAIE
jgi:hypothetical protein